MVGMLRKSARFQHAFGCGKRQHPQVYHRGPAVGMTNSISTFQVPVAMASTMAALSRFRRAGNMPTGSVSYIVSDAEDLIS